MIAPRYGAYEDAVDTGVRKEIALWGGSHEVGYFHCFRDNVDYIFVDHPGRCEPPIVPFVSPRAKP